MSKFCKTKKTNNAVSATKAKIALRKNIFEQIDSQKVLEVFCGSGVMFDSCYSGAEKYTGIDKVKFFDGRHTICGDAEKAIRLINISEYNIFDIDAYGDPYLLLDYITKNISAKYKKIGFIVTDGIEMDMRMGRICEGVRSICGIENHIAKKAHLIHDEIISICVENIAARLSGKASCFMLAKGNTAAKMRYYSFIVDIE